MNSRPEQYVPQSYGGNFDLGVGGNIRQLYASYLDVSTPGVITVDSVTRNVEPQVVAMLKAILQAGCCRIEERAMACKKVFDQCLRANTREEFVSMFDDSTKDEFIQAIYKAVRKEWRL